MHALRRVQPEILDDLPAEDPRAVRSRRDLRLINRLMGNHRWVLRHVAEHSGRVVELGAGDGCLARRIGADSSSVDCW